MCEVQITKWDQRFIYMLIGYVIGKHLAFLIIAVSN